MTSSEPHPLSPAAWNRRHLVEALESVWDDDLLDHLLHPAAADMRIHGLDAATVIDAISHRLAADSAGVWDSHGFSAHQGHLIDTDPKAVDNLWGRSMTSIDAILESDIPRDYLVNVLRVATSPDEVDKFIDNWQGATPEQRADYAEREAMQAALLDHPNPIPGCCP
jgi:hypothetical protein